MTKIYESPDKGQTVYERDFGSLNKTVVNVQEGISENLLWWSIREEAKTNPTLQAALDQCIMIYKLSKDYTDV